MLLPAILCFCLARMAMTAATPEPTVRLATFGVGDTLLIVVIALIVFGPKKLPEISRQLGKLLYEFRKASNDFKFQIEEELRAAEQAERQKQLNTQAANPQPATPVTLAAGETVSAESEGVRSPENLQPESNESGTNEATATGPAGQDASSVEESQPLAARERQQPSHWKSSRPTLRRRSTQRLPTGWQRPLNPKDLPTRTRYPPIMDENDHG